MDTVRDLALDSAHHVVDVVSPPDHLLPKRVVRVVQEREIKVDTKESLASRPLFTIGVNFWEDTEWVRCVRQIFLPHTKGVHECFSHSRVVL